MKFIKEMAMTAFSITVSATAMAAVSQQEADELGGAKLTEFGAEKAGNADGSIPAYTGGLPPDTAPAGWKKDSGRYDHTPFDDDKPLYSISSANLDQYADHLSAGAIAMLKKYPEYRMDIYPTRRTVGYPKEWLSHCKANATSVKLTDDGNGIVGGHSCVAFPIPKNGLELQWSYATRYIYGVSGTAKFSDWLIDASGHVNDIGRVIYPTWTYWSDPALSTMPESRLAISGGIFAGPPALVGTKILQTRSLDYDKSDTQGWFYSPGQRRVRVAPEFSYDTPIAQYGGAITYDEQYGFGGNPDRFDWKLVGKKELYVPYNDYKYMYAPMDQLVTGKPFVNPDVMRFEKHRVWVLESTLKPGKRHIYSRRTFYIDEDSWAIVASDSYDQGGKLYRAGFVPSIVLWDHQTYVSGHNFYDMTKGSFLAGPVYTKPDDNVIVQDSGPSNPAVFSPEGMAGNGIR